MDSLSQLVLGAACGVAVMGRRTAVWKAALWGGICGTLPDLDVFIDYGDAVRNMTYHRAESHSLVFLTLLAPLMGWLASKLHRQPDLLKHWCWALWFALVTHPLLDNFTIYGTQLLQPFSDYPYAVGSMFIVDPVYTLPLLLGLMAALSMRPFAGLRWNALALGFSSLYLVWSIAAQAYVQAVVHAQLAADGRADAEFFVTPTPFNTIAWRVVVKRKGGYSEGFYSFLDQDQTISFDDFPSNPQLSHALAGNWAVQRMALFTRGFYSLREVDGYAVLADLRMGQEPGYVFQFALAMKEAETWKAIVPRSAGDRGDPSKLLPWLWARIWGEDIPPPR
jgi:inner membrane protein